MKKGYVIIRQGTKKSLPRKGLSLKLKHPPSVVHFCSFEEALKEAKRLSAKFPNEDFAIFEAVTQVTTCNDKQFIRTLEQPDDSEVDSFYDLYDSDDWYLSK